MCVNTCMYIIATDYITIFVSGSLCGLWLCVAMDNSRRVELHKGALLAHHRYSKGEPLRSAAKLQLPWLPC